MTHNISLYKTLLPILEKYVHVFGYRDFDDFSQNHKDHLYAEVIESDTIDFAQLSELIVLDEFLLGVFKGYIKPQDIKADLQERLHDLLERDLNDWVAEIYVEQYGRPGPDLHEIQWQSEMKARAQDINTQHAVGQFMRG